MIEEKLTENKMIEERLLELTKLGDQEAANQLAVIYARQGRLSDTARSIPELRKSLRDIFHRQGKLDYRIMEITTYNKALKKLSQADEQEQLPLQPLCEYEGKMLPRPLTFKEVIQASIEHPQLLEYNFYTFTAVAYSTKSDDIIIIPEYKGLFAFAQKALGAYLPVDDFDALRTQGYVMNRNHFNQEQAWLYALDNDQGLLQQFQQLLVQNNYSSNLKMWMIPKEGTIKDQVRSLIICSQKPVRIADKPVRIADAMLMGTDSFLRTAHSDSPVMGWEEKIKY